MIEINTNTCFQSGASLPAVSVKDSHRRSTLNIDIEAVVFEILEKVISNIIATCEEDGVLSTVDEEDERIYGLRFMTKSELYEIAKDLEII